VIPLVRIIDGRWVLPILHTLHDGPLRRSALRQQLDAVSDKVLTETLRRLQRHHLITRTAIATVPVEVDYALTALAHSLWPILADMQAWAVLHEVELDPPFGTG
jgi:DNA-binding HxlR family transcriptional regulator